MQAGPNVLSGIEEDLSERACSSSSVFQDVAESHLAAKNASMDTAKSDLPAEEDLCDFLPIESVSKYDKNTSYSSYIFCLFHASKYDN